MAVLADVSVKHSKAVADRDLGAVTRETLDRGRADGLVVSGPGTGRPADAAHLQTVLEAREEVSPEAPVFVGSGVTVEDAPALLDVADGLIVGTALKQDGRTANPVDPDRVQSLVEAVRGDQ